jgi:hypothetical protein
MTGLALEDANPERLSLWNPLADSAPMPRESRRVFTREVNPVYAFYVERPGACAKAGIVESFESLGFSFWPYG